MKKYTLIILLFFSCNCLLGQNNDKFKTSDEEIIFQRARKEFDLLALEPKKNNFIYGGFYGTSLVGYLRNVAIGNGTWFYGGMIAYDYLLHELVSISVDLSFKYFGLEALAQSYLINIMAGIRIKYDLIPNVFEIGLLPKIGFSPLITSASLLNIVQTYTSYGVALQGAGDMRFKFENMFLFALLGYRHMFFSGDGTGTSEPVGLGGFMFSVGLGFNW